MGFFSDVILRRKQGPTHAATPRVSALIAKAQTAGITANDYTFVKPYIPLIQDTAATCLALRASERSALTFKITEYDKETTLSKRLSALLNQPNPALPRTEFLALASQHLDVTGNLLMLVVSDGAADQEGTPAEFWILPSYAFDLLDERGIPLQTGSENILPTYYRWNEVVLPADRIIHIRRASIKSGPYKGRGIVQDEITTLQTFASVLKAQRRYFETDGIPNAAITFPVGVTSQDINTDDLRATWKEKFNAASGEASLAVIPDGGTLVTFGPKELDFRESKKELRDAIREAFGVPKIMLGDTDSVNFNNGVTSMAIFRHAVVQRFGQQIADALTAYFHNAIHPAIKVEVEDTATNAPQEFSKGTPPVNQLDPSAVAAT